jgi:hypothetical protein
MLAHRPLNSTENQQYPSDHRDRTKIEGLEETGAHQCERCSDRVAPFELCPTPEAYFRPADFLAQFLEIKILPRNARTWAAESVCCGAGHSGHSTAI